jgi:DNA-binding NtrC family response regulator
MIAPDLPPIISVSEAMKRAQALVERFAPTGLTILLVGATGTGKELLARHIHHRSRRRGELVDLNCGALPRDMMESLLFGHRRGAFTGAVETTVGYVERANAGTLFLDEVLHLSPEGQVKLLRVLETNEVERLGEGRKREVDLRVVAAAQDEATGRLDAGSFRRDLFQRLAGVVIELPPLVERPEDIVPLAEHFASLRGQVLEPGTARVLDDYFWPGNVRELRLAIERAGCLVENGTLPPDAVRDAITLGTVRDRRAAPRGSSRERRVLDRATDIQPSRGSQGLLALCEAHGWDARSAAASLGVSRSTFYERLKSAGISLRSGRNALRSEFHRNSPEFRT